MSPNKTEMRRDLLISLKERPSQNRIDFENSKKCLYLVIKKIFFTFFQSFTARK